MITHLVKHITPSDETSSNGVLVSRSMGAIGGKTKPVRIYKELEYEYNIDPTNGDTILTVNTVFPSGKYAELNFVPQWDGYRFVGWFKSPLSPSSSIPSMNGVITKDDSVKYSVKTVYAHWQLPVNITFDATSEGGVFPTGWEINYYAGQPYGELPKPTHETLNFTGWYDAEGNRITSTSIVPEGGITLTARYSAQSYTVDLNGQWQLSGTQNNPDSSLYDGVYESFSNKGVSSSFAKMYIRLIGYTNFRIYIRSYAESSYDYVIAFNPDVDVISGTPSSSSTGVKTSTSDKQSSGQAISNYTPVDYELDGGEHFIVIGYRKDSSTNSGNDQGYVLIPKEQ